MQCFRAANSIRGRPGGKAGRDSDSSLRGDCRGSQSAGHAVTANNGMESVLKLCNNK